VFVNNGGRRFESGYILYAWTSGNIFANNEKIKRKKKHNKRS